MSFNLEEEVGGKDAFRKMMRVFYDRLFDDVFVGFLFTNFDKEKLMDDQISWLSAHLGDRSGIYEGKNLRAAHKNMAILPGHFNRRHLILKQLLSEYDIADHVVEAWLKLDQGLYSMIVRVGAETRKKPAKVNLLD